MLNEGKLLIGENAPQGVQMDKGMPRHALCLLRPVQTNYGGRTRVCCSFSRPGGVAVHPGGSIRPPLGASISRRGSRREAVGEPRRGAPAFRPLAAVSFPQRLNLGDVKEFIKLKTARARYGV